MKWSDYRILGSSGAMKVARNHRRTLPQTILFLNLLFTLPYTTALQVLQNSNCTSVCSPSSSAPSTDGSDIVCDDGAYNTTSVGQSYQTCLTCELASTQVDQASGQTDLGWGLYNMRYTLDWCLYGFPEANNQTASNPCGVSCAPLNQTLETNILTPNHSTPYDYCQDPHFISEVAVCANCYALVTDHLYLSNFLKALRSACQTQPPPSTLFPIPPSQIFTINPPATYPTSTSAASSNHHLSHAGILAIAITIPVVLVLFLLAFFIYWYKRFQKASNNPRYPHSGPDTDQYSYPEHDLAISNFNFSSQHDEQSTATESIPEEVYSPYPYPDGVHMNYTPGNFPAQGIGLQEQEPQGKGKQRSEMLSANSMENDGLGVVLSPFTPPPGATREGGEDEEEEREEEKGEEEEDDEPSGPRL
ncbi:hypothetical protein MMC06_005620 [Schaereria dolodes]|nr:hypothetical protein [Schaereria dolodes]